MIEINLQKLQRGTHTAPVKVTRDGKTFYQQRRVGRKKTDGDITKKIRDYEDTIREQDYETAAVFDDKGDVVFTKDGESDAVNFTKEEGESFEGLRFTHNHPKGFGFSPQDIKFACKAKMKEIRVVSKIDGVRYSLSMKDGSNFTHKLWEEKIYLDYDYYDSEIRREFYSKMNDGEMTIAEANAQHFPKLWDMVAEDISELKYEVS